MCERRNHMAHIELADGVYGIRGLMMRRPDIAEHLNELASILLHDEHSLTQGERELIATAVSRANTCEYCSNIHASIAASHLGITRSSVFEAIDDLNQANISPKVKALILLAKQVRESGKQVTEELIQQAKSNGANETEIHDTILIGASFSMFNRYVDGLATPVPEEYHVFDTMGKTRSEQGYRATLKVVIAFMMTCLFSANMIGQNGSIKGTVKLEDTKEPAGNVRVIDQEAKRNVYTNKVGSFIMNNLKAGKHQLLFKGLEVRDTVLTVDVREGITTEISVEVERRSVISGEVVVSGSSKKMEKIAESPSAVTVISGQEIQRRARGNQLGKALEGLPGVDIVQNGATDFNVNTRGFNNSTNRRLLVLVDGRDVALQQIGAVEWNSFASSLSDFRSIELVRGPAAALYGANAFNGVLNMTTLSPRESMGTRISVLGGDYKTMRTDIRHAGAFGDLSYKFTLGRSQSYNLAQNRVDSSSIVSEYPSLWPAARELNAISSEDRETFATYGTLRMDYDLNETQTLTTEFGYSRFGNEVMLAGAGRIHVPESEKPFARLAFHDDNVHIQATYNARRTVDTMRVLAAPPGTIILDDSYDLNLDAQYNDTLSRGIRYVIGGQYQYMNIGSNRTVFYNDPIQARIGGLYGQIEADLTDNLSIVGSARYDNANIFPEQFSPRIALLYTPWADQRFRVSAGRSFQRANFSELYRKYAFRPAFSAQGRPVNFRPVQGQVNGVLSTLTGAPQNVFLGLYDTTVTSPTNPMGIQPAAWGVGNEDLNVEQSIGFEFGYNGKIGNKLYVTADVYYNRLTNFISGFLPGVNENYKTWSSTSILPANLQQYAGLVDSIVYAQMSPQDKARFTTYEGKPAFIVSNTNIGLVEQFGVELSATYTLTKELDISANYAYFRANLLDAKTSNPFLKTGDDLLSPNTSPHRVNLTASYTKQQEWDASITMRYVEGFNWLAGDFKGYVPSFSVVNLNAGVNITNDLRLGLVVNNLFDRRYYEVYGGSILPRLTYFSATYSFD